MLVHHRIFIESRIFTKLIGGYLNDDEYAALQQHLLKQPKAGPIIRSSGGVRKLRWSVQGKGKSGGVRVIYYIRDGSSFWMLTIYSKGELDTIPGPLLKKIKEAMEDGEA